MSMFDRDEDAPESEDRLQKRRIAEEISSGLVSGLFERDEEVWEIVKEIEEKKDAPKI